MLQEHWLPPFDLHKLDSISPNFTSFASSAMSETIKCDILKCRPYGGVAFLVRNNIVSKVRCIVKSKQYIILRVENLILVNVYMPCKSTGNCTDEYAEVLGCILNYVADFPTCDFVIGGDFNCEFVPSERILWPLLCEFMSQCSLVSTDDLIGDDKCYTYHQATTGAASHIDHFIVSRGLLDCLQSVTILDDGSNLSDHLPVTMVCDLSSRAAFWEGRMTQSMSVEKPVILMYQNPQTTIISCDGINLI